MSQRWVAMLLLCFFASSGTGAYGVVHVSYIKNEDPRVQKMNDHFLDMEPPVTLNQLPSSKHVLEIRMQLGAEITFSVVTGGKKTFHCSTPTKRFNPEDCVAQNSYGESC